MAAPGDDVKLASPDLGGLRLALAEMAVRSDQLMLAHCQRPRDPNGAPLDLATCLARYQGYREALNDVAELLSPEVERADHEPGSS